MLNNTAIIVLGMHRSGTSALAGALALLGVDMGRSLLAPADDNVRGLWEHEELVRLHDRLLSAFESSWDDVSHYRNHGGPMSGSEHFAMT